MDDQLAILQDVAARLERAGIPYMLTGSMALSYYEMPRMTRDIDIVVEAAGLEPAAVAALAWAKDSGSELQMRDVRSLLAGKLDRVYLDRWATALEVSELLTKCLDG